MKRVHVKSSILLLAAVSALALILGGLSPAFAQEAPSVSGELERHAPIVGNTTVSQAELEKILASLGNNTVDPRISSLLSRMNESLRSGDYDSYNKAREELKLYLDDLPSNNYEANMDLATIEKLALLASTTLYGRQGVLNSTEFAKIVSELGSKPGGEAELNNLFNSTGGNQAGSKEGKPPSIPQVPHLNTGGPSRLSIGLELWSLVLYFLGIVGLAVATYVLYRYRSHFTRKLLGLTGIIIRKIKYREPAPADPRGAIIYCFKLLSEILSWLGYRMASWETPREYLSRVKLEGLAKMRERIIRAVEEAKYSPRTPEPRDVEECDNILRRVDKL